MTDVPSLATLRQVFALVFPMQGVVVVGAGRGQGLEDFRSAASVLLVDARRECIEPLQKQCVALPNATAVQAVIAARSGAVAFHFASKPDESALITPESLQPLWRNLTTNSMDEVEAVTLPDLLASLAPEPDFRCNWLVIDCLPALSVLEGAGEIVEDFDVIELRCVRDGTVLMGGGVSLESSEQRLKARGFCLAALFEEIHPQLCKAVFCRDVSKLEDKVGDLTNDLAQLRRSNEEQLLLLSIASGREVDMLAQLEKLAADSDELRRICDAESKRRREQEKSLVAERDTLARAKAAAEKLAAERQTLLEALGIEQKTLLSARDALTEERTVLMTERDVLAEEKQALITEVQVLTAERDALAQAKAAVEKLAAERQTALDTLAVEQKELMSVRESLTQEKTALISERDDLIRQNKKFSSDADIDDFINDISPFFANRSIVYVDVGAYTGEVFIKLLAAKTLRIREAHLIEPNPSSYQQLRDAVKAINLPSCNTYNIGISNKPGTAKFKAAKSMTKKVSFDLSCEDATNIFEVECRRLDEFANLFTDGRVNLMKLDVEGEEIDVIESAEYLFREQRVDVLYVEVGFNRVGTQQTYFGFLDTLLQGYGYRVFKIYEQTNEWIDDSPLLRRCNVAYMSSKFESGNPYTRIRSTAVS